MNKNDYEKYIELLSLRLSDYRLKHSIAVAHAARELAARYGADEEKMFTAGLLHDILKEADREEIFALCEKYSLEMTPLEKSTPKLWHAMLGSEFVRRELKIDDADVVSAIRYHTTGRANMSLSEKVLFIADFISEDRSYPDVGVMREKARQSLDSAAVYALSFTIASLAKKGGAIHEDTLFAYNDFVLKGEKNAGKGTCEDNNQGA